MFSFDRFLFPPQNFMLQNKSWLTKPYDFYGGQKVNEGPPRGGPPVDYLTVRPCDLAYSSTASCHGCRAGVAPLPWSTDLPLMACPGRRTCP